VCCAVVFLLVKLLAGVQWLPTNSVIESLAEPWVTLGALAVGLGAGLLLAVMQHDDRLTVTVSAERVRLEGVAYDATFERADIGAVFAFRREVVLVGHDDGELARRSFDLRTAELKTVFTRHDYPWQDDPYADE